eukprot:12960227-Alexandrium_andersonii.AAC.1
MDVHFGQPEQNRDPRAEQRQDGGRAEHRRRDHADQGAEAGTGRAGTGGGMGPLALIGLVIWAFG